MAYYAGDEEDEKQQDPNAQTAVQTSAPDAIISGQGSSAPAPQGQAPGTPDKSSNFVGIKQYLDANKQQSAKLGDQVAGKVQGTIQDASNSINSLGDAFKTKANAGQISNIGNAQNDANSITQAAATNGNLSQDQKNRFGEVSNAQYTGPNSLIDDTEDYQPAEQKLLDAQNEADLSKTETGNQQLLRQTYNTNPNYTVGANRFDSYLLNSDDNKQKLADARTNASGLQGQLDTQTQSAADYAAQQKTLADQIRAATQKNLGQTQTQRNTDVQNELDAMSGHWNDDYNHYLSLLQNSGGGTNLQLTPEESQKLGIDVGSRLFNVLDPAKGNSPSQYLTQQAFDPNKSISKEEQAELSALDELANMYGGPLLNKHTQADLAGTQTPDQAFDASKFTNAVSNANNSFKQNLSNAPVGDIDFDPAALAKYLDLSPPPASLGQALNDYLKQIGYYNTAKAPGKSAAPKTSDGQTILTKTGK